MVPKVSVSLITYKHEKFIAQAIESVLAQRTDFDLELVISDDASPDGTAEITEKYAKQFPDMIRLQNKKKNVGVVENAIQTIAQCRGEYIALLEGDDFWIDEHKLQKQVNFLDNNKDCAFCYTNGRIFWEGNDSKPDERSITFDLPQKFDLGYFLRNNTPLLNNTKMFRRSVHPTTFPQWYYETVQWDWVLHSMHAKNQLIGYLDDETLGYRRHAEAFIISYDREKLYRSGLRVNKCLNELLDYQYDDFFRNTWWYHEQLMQIQLKESAYLEAFGSLIKSMINRPLRSISEYRDLSWKIRQAIRDNKDT